MSLIKLLEMVNNSQQLNEENKKLKQFNEEIRDMVSKDMHDWFINKDKILERLNALEEKNKKLEDIENRFNVLREMQELLAQIIEINEEKFEVIFNSLKR